MNFRYLISFLSLILGGLYSLMSLPMEIYRYTFAMFSSSLHSTNESPTIGLPPALNTLPLSQPLQTDEEALPPLSPLTVTNPLRSTLENAPTAILRENTEPHHSLPHPQYPIISIIPPTPPNPTKEIDSTVPLPDQPESVPPSSFLFPGKSPFTEVYVGVDVVGDNNKIESKIYGFATFISPRTLITLNNKKYPTPILKLRVEHRAVPVTSFKEFSDSLLVININPKQYFAVLPCIIYVDKAIDGSVKDVLITGATVRSRKKVIIIKNSNIIVDDTYITIQKVYLEDIKLELGKALTTPSGELIGLCADFNETSVQFRRLQTKLSILLS